MKTPFAVG
jgi:hypothetical protein